MPEYLAPGVYVEEIDTGTKPIEGVSTSTAGMIGVAERGPVNVPILVTSYGEYTRVFGERLNILDFSSSPTDPHCYLAQAVEGFFLNGGKRVYVTRILNTEGATRSSFVLHDRGTSTSASTVLLLPASEGDGASSPIYVLDQSGLSAGPPPTRVRVGDGSDAEYRTLAAAPGDAVHAALSFPLSHGYDSGVAVQDVQRVLAATPNSFTLAEDAKSGATRIAVTVGASSDIALDDLLEIGSSSNGELRFVRGFSAATGQPTQVTLDSPLRLSYPATTTVITKLDPNPAGPGQHVDDNTLDSAARTGDSVVLLASVPTGFTDRDDLVIFDLANNETRQARRIGSLSLLNLASGAYRSYSRGATIESVTLIDDDPGGTRTLDTAPSPGSNIIHITNRVGLAVGDVLRIDATPNQEFATIRALPSPSPGGAPPNAGNVVLNESLSLSHAPTTEINLQKEPVLNTAKPTTTLILPAAAGARQLVVSDGGDGASQFKAGDTIRVTNDDEVTYHSLASDSDAVDARPITLNLPLTHVHAAGSAIAERAQLLEVEALDAGTWGNRLRVSVEDETPGLLTRTTLSPPGGATQIHLGSIAGVEVGSILELVNPMTGASEGELLKVLKVNRTTGDITLQGAGLSAAQISAINSLPNDNPMVVRSREFRLSVYLLRQPDPATPTRDTSILDLEVFRNLSLDHRHSRYAHKVIGTTFSQTPGTTEDNDGNPLRLYDRRSEGESWYVRVRDVALDLSEPARTTAFESVRLGPETLIDILPDGRQRAARHALEQGNDSIGTLSDDTYIGDDSDTPENRTGLHSLRNVEDISIVACPGRTSSAIQNALITHCELMRYRFAVLDGRRPPNDSLSDIQSQRQQYDTKYAALYHPWVLVPDPFPTNLARVGDYPLPPSGHIVGIYARTDIDRGVHKAPANEVVRGITGLQRTLNKGEQDILNPFPVNINVIRDFRSNNRGLRVFGARVLTQDPDWKYINVRRLMIFIEASIDRGLQWVVFEPNAEPLWARVRRSVSNFLTQVWRDGGLEGTKVEEAYFVKCDRTTMTQTDIDNGRLIVLIGVAPVKPAEFVIIRIGLFTAHADN